ncbi:hypothetical protein F5146DRAFT_766155 [Armillaria mellea]|nr:hypothetical protein F5146DRAFT_766155 [Armillaria mellea]
MVLFDLSASSHYSVFLLSSVAHAWLKVPRNMAWLVLFLRTYFCEFESRRRESRQIWSEETVRGMTLSNGCSDQSLLVRSARQCSRLRFLNYGIIFLRSGRTDHCWRFLVCLGDEHEGRTISPINRSRSRPLHIPVGPGGQTPPSRFAPAAVFTSANSLDQQRLQFGWNYTKGGKKAAAAGKGWFDQIHLGCHAHR